MPGSIPVGGGVDGPQYADYQDVTDQQQIAGAATSMKEKLLVMQDSLVLDIAKFSGGDIKPYAAKAHAPTVPMYIQLRSTGPMETTTKNIENFEAEFMKMLEQLPAKLRQLLLKNMNLPKGQRNPELDGLEETIKQQIEVRLWAKGILKRFRRKGDEEKEEQERKGVFTLEEEEELIPEGTVIPKANYVPIAAVDPLASQDEVSKQLQANAVFVIKCHLDILEMQLDSIAPTDPARSLLNGFPTLIKRMLGHSKAFVNLHNFLGYGKAKQAAVSLNKLHLSLVEEQRHLLEKASRYSEGAPSSNITSFAIGILGIVVICCNVLRSPANLTALHTRGIALEQALMMTSGSTMGEHLTALYSTLGSALESLDIDSETVKVMQLIALATCVAIPLLTVAEALPYFVSFVPEKAEGLSTAFREEDQTKEEAARKLQEVAKTAAVQLSAAVNTAAAVFEEGIHSLIPTDSTAISTLLKLAILTLVRLTGQTYLEKIGGSSAELFLTVTNAPYLQAATQLQEEVDNGSFKSKATETLNELHLGELPLQAKTLMEQLTDRDKVLGRLGIDSKTLKMAAEELAILIASLAYSLSEEAREQQQVVPNVNVIV